MTNTNTNRTVEVIKGIKRHYNRAMSKTRYFPIWMVLVDGVAIVGDCDNAFTTLRAARAAAKAA